MPAQQPDDRIAQLEKRVVEIVRTWFKAERKQQRSPIGLPNATLKLADVLRNHFPLEPEHYTSRGGSQMKGLSGRSGDRIIARFMPGMRPLGTESGRTSRGILPAIRRLATRLNALVPDLPRMDTSDRARLADAIQQWIVENPIRAYFAADKLQPALNPGGSSTTNVAMILSTAQQRNQVGQVAQHIVGAKLELRYPGEHIDNYSYSTADAPTGRQGDFLLGSTVFHVTMAASAPLVRKCRRNLRQGYRVVVLVPESRREGAAQIMGTEGLNDHVTVMGIETFVGQNIEEMAKFDRRELEALLRRLLEVYNARVQQAEPDPSLQIEIPANLGS